MSTCLETESKKYKSDKGKERITNPKKTLLCYVFCGRAFGDKPDTKVVYDFRESRGPFIEL